MPTEPSTYDQEMMPARAKPGELVEMLRERARLHAEKHDIVHNGQHADQCSYCLDVAAANELERKGAGLNADQHGATCAETPIDHRCGDMEMDQGVTFQDALAIDSSKLQEIAYLHSKGQTVGGMTTGYCSECEAKWPCPTVHLANGWGRIDQCEEDGFCTHAGEKL